MRTKWVPISLLAAALGPAAANLVAQDAPAVRSAAASQLDRPAKAFANRCPQLPRAITSFGAAASGGWVYVYGGHIGREHRHSRENVVGEFGRLDPGDGSWQALPSGPALQGTALVAATDGSLYRVGGLTAHNAPDADADLHSTASVDRYEPASGRWQAATPLPEPRSSHDAVVLGEHLYVVGGWSLAGGDAGRWLDTAWRADLRSQPLQWQPIAAPAPRRAAALAAFDGRLAFVGGLTPAGEMSAAVEFYDPARDAWHAGPDLLGGGFGTAVLGVGERLFASVMDGRLLEWTGSGWQLAASFVLPRFFHRLVPGRRPGELLALGGASAGGHTRTTEWLEVDAPTAGGWQEFSIPAPGEVAERQALVVAGHTLYAFGGGRGRPGDRFAPSQFAADIWRIDLLQRTAERVGAMPSGRQSAAAVALGGRGSIWLLGGLGVTPSGDVATLADGWHWQTRRAELQAAPALPAPRTQGQVLWHGDRLWWLGGVDFLPEAGGGSQRGSGRDVYVCDPSVAEPRFEPSPVVLPRARRSFAAVSLAGQILLLGGLGDGFHHAGPIDVYDCATASWSEIVAPVPWVSPQAAVIGDRVYVGCGGTMQGQKFTADPRLWSWSAREGWRVVVDELPLPPRGVQMFALRNRLWFYAIEGEGRRRIVVRTFEPDRSVFVAGAAMHR